METGRDHGGQHYHYHGMVSTIGYCVAPYCLGSKSQPCFSRSSADITRQALFVNGYLATKKKINTSKGGNRPWQEESKKIAEVPEEAYPGD
jgi:hypothetical protein